MYNLKVSSSYSVDREFFKIVTVFKKTFQFSHELVFITRLFKIKKITTPTIQPPKAGGV